MDCAVTQYSGLDAGEARRLRRESDRDCVAMQPGILREDLRTGGGRTPDFWNAFEDGEDRVIGEEPCNTLNDQDLSEVALS